MAELATLDALRAQNIALQVQLSSQERELAQSRNALQLALTKAGSIGSVLSRVVLSKALNHVPTKVWAQPAHHPDEEAAATAAIEALQEQLANAQADLETERAHRTALEQHRAAADAEISRLKQSAVQQQQQQQQQHSGASSDAKPQSAVVAHLMAQIKFLHEEVERLEGAASEARDQGSQEAAGAAQRFARESMAKDRELERLRLDLTRARSALRDPSSARSTSLDSGAKEVEEALRVAVAERNAALMDKTDLQTKLRRMEGTVKTLKASVASAEQAGSREEDRHQHQAKELHGALASVARENENLREELEHHRRRAARPHHSIDVQCSATPVSQVHCQTETDEPRTTTSSCQVGGAAVTAAASYDTEKDGPLAAILEEKCSELDSMRAVLEEAREGTHFSAMSLKRVQEALQEEGQRRRSAEAEVDRLNTQVRALQQQASQLQVSLRDSHAECQKSEARAQEAIAGSLRAEEERRVWEAQLASNAKDLDTVVAQQSMANQQASAAAAEADELRSELQKALHHEAQLQYELKAKQAEIAEVIGAYQQCVRETESQSHTISSIERECDNLRGIVTVRDERIAGMADQVADLHQREQQLIMDLQSVDYENGLLHRKLVAAENACAQTEARADENAGALRASQKVIQDFERSHAELHKQVVVKENELMLLRQRCEDATRETAAATHAQREASRKISELEDTNSKLAVKGLMAKVAHDDSDATVAASLEKMQQANSDLAQANHELQSLLDETKRSLDHVTQVLNDENATGQTLRDEVTELREQRDALSASQARLEQLVQEQATQLASLE